MSLQVELLEEIFNDIKPYGSQFVSRFYENLFKAYPETKSLFAAIDPETQKQQLWDYLVLVFENLRQPGTLKNIIQGLGAKLYIYGALPKHYPQAKDAFSTTFEQFLASAWTTEFEQAWNDAYLTFRELMLDGAEQTRIQMARMHPVLESEKIIKEETEITEEILETSVTESEETPEQEVVVNTSNDNSLLEVKLNTTVLESTDIVQEKALTVEELLTESFNDIKSYGNLFVNTCYENLFKAHPELKSLFTAPDPETKKTQLWDDLVLIMDNLNQPENLNNILRGLGAKLFTYGVLPEHYSLLKDALFTTFEQFLGSEWTTDFKHAWLNAYVNFGGMMIEGAAQAQHQIAHKTHLPESEQRIEEEVVVVTGTDNSVAEEELETPVAKLDEDIWKTSVTESEKTLEPEVAVVAETDSSLGEEELETPVAELDEDIWETPVTESEETLEPEVAVVAETDSFLGEEVSETPFAESEEILEEEVVVASIDNSSAEDIRSTSPSESVNIVEEGVTIRKSTDNYSEKTKTTMPKSDNNIPQEDAMLEQSQDFLEENILADVSETVKSENIDPQFTQVFSPEMLSESRARATATVEKPVAGAGNYESENESSQSNKKLLVGGGVLGIGGIIWLLIVLL